jgi:hypothetical protein
MQTTGVSGAAISENLSFAISRLEEMLNKQDRLLKTTNSQRIPA